MNKLNLKPCPFCGEPDQGYLEVRQVFGGIFPNYSYVKCRVCGGMMFDTNTSHSIEDLIEKWNRREKDETN